MARGPMQLHRLLRLNVGPGGAFQGTAKYSRLLQAEIIEMRRENYSD